MSYKIFVSMNIAVIGSGSIAEGFATRYALAGHEVYIGRKEGDQQAASEILSTFDNIHFCSIEEAAAVSDLIVIAAVPADVREVAYWLGDVRRKVIIDASANLQTGFEEKINTVCAIKAITGSEYIVKVFSTRGYEKLLKPLFKDENVRLVLAGTSKKAKEVAKILTRDLGVHLFYDLGEDDAIPLFNSMTKAWKQLLVQSIPQNHKLEGIK